MPAARPAGWRHRRTIAGMKPSSASPSPGHPSPPRDPIAELAKAVVVRIESEMDAHGWDAPPTLWELRTVDIDELGPIVDVLAADEPTESISLDELREKLASPDTLRSDGPALAAMVGAMASAFSLSLVECIESHPFDAMVGYVADADVVAVALCNEGWDYPERLHAELAAGAELGPPSSYPDRRELRQVTVVWRDGTEAMVIRHRGTDPEVHSLSTGGTMDVHGRVPGALRRTVGRPSRTLRSDELPNPYAQARAWWCWMTLGLLGAGVESPVAAMSRDELIELSTTYPELLLGFAPLPGSLFTPLVRTVSTGQAYEAGWEQLRTESRPPRLASEQDWSAWQSFAAWADAELVAGELPSAPPAAESVARLRALDTLDAASIDRLAELCDPSVPFPDPDPGLES